MAFNNKLFVQCIVLVAILACCTAQLTFSPGWGKRSGSASNVGSGSPSSTLGGTTGSGDSCRPTSDSLMLIYHFIQAEAQQYLECQKNAQNNF